MNAFIEDYLEWVEEMLGDPSGQRRATPAKRLRDLHAHHMTLYERFSRAAGNMMRIGFAETDITVENEKDFYQLPGNFRKFISFKRFSDDNPNNLVDEYPTIDDWADGSRGIIILSPQQGFRIRPRPTIDADQTWTLRYEVRPIRLHWGIAQSVTETTITLQDNLPEAQGQIVRQTDYYKGSLIHIVDATTGVGQSIDVISFSPESLTCTLRHSFNPIPTGAVKYEFRTELPRGYDKIFALSVAMAQTANRTNSEAWRALHKEWREFYSAARAFFSGPTRDRPHRPNASTVETTVDPLAM